MMIVRDLPGHIQANYPPMKIINSSSEAEEILGVEWVRPELVLWNWHDEDEYRR